MNGEYGGVNQMDFQLDFLKDKIEFFEASSLKELECNLADCSFCQSSNDCD